MEQKIKKAPTLEEMLIYYRKNKGTEKGYISFPAKFVEESNRKWTSIHKKIDNE